MTFWEAYFLVGFVFAGVILVYDLALSKAVDGVSPTRLFIVIVFWPFFVAGTLFDACRK